MSDVPSAAGRAATKPNKTLRALIWVAFAAAVLVGLSVATVMDKGREIEHATPAQTWTSSSWSSAEWPSFEHYARHVEDAMRATTVSRDRVNTLTIHSKECARLRSEFVGGKLDVPNTANVECVDSDGKQVWMFDRR